MAQESVLLRCSQVTPMVGPSYLNTIATEDPLQDGMVIRSPDWWVIKARLGTHGSVLWLALWSGPGQ